MPERSPRRGLHSQRGPLHLEFLETRAVFSAQGLGQSALLLPPSPPFGSEIVVRSQIASPAVGIVPSDSAFAEMAVLPPQRVGLLVGARPCAGATLDTALQQFLRQLEDIGQDPSHGPVEGVRSEPERQRGDSGLPPCRSGFDRTPSAGTWITQGMARSSLLSWFLGVTVGGTLLEATRRHLRQSRSRVARAAAEEEDSFTLIPGLPGPLRSEEP